MSLDFIGSLREKGVLSPEDAAYLGDIRSGRLFSLRGELRAALYLGALFIVAGVGASVSRYVHDLGHLSIIGSLAAAVAASAWYCFARAAPFSPRKVESPTAAFDYVLYLGCAILGILFGYLEAEFHILDRFWDYYLLLSGCLFVGLAYRFDNRMVLALGLLDLGGWFGVRSSRWNFEFLTLRTPAILFGASCVAAGKALAGREVKAHFLDAYITIGLQCLFLAALSGLGNGFVSPYFLLLALLTAATVSYALAERRFQYFLYGVGYSYIGVSYCVLDHSMGVASISLYFILSASALLRLIFRFRRVLEQKA